VTKSTLLTEFQRISVGVCVWVCVCVCVCVWGGDRALQKIVVEFRAVQLATCEKISMNHDLTLYMFTETRK
jgi:hypothetical protein